MSVVDEGIALLRALDDEGAPFVVIGSFAVALVAPDWLEAEPRDVDVLAPFDVAVLERLVRALGARRLRVTSWEEPVTLPLVRARLAGRLYLRARAPSGLVVDVTYECPPLPFAEAAAAATQVAGLPVAAMPHLLRLAAARGAPRDRALLRRASRRRTCGQRADIGIAKVPVDSDG